MSDDNVADSTGKEFGLPSLTMLVIASMVGAGVFTTSGYTLGSVGSPSRVMLCWVIGSIIAICGAVAYGHLARLVPESGGEYLYLSRRVSPFAGFLAGWVSLTAGFSGAIATAAVAFEQYAIPESQRPGFLPNDMIAILVVLLCGAVHGLHKSRGKFFQNVVVCIKIAALAVFLLVAATKLSSHEWQWAVSEPRPTGGLALLTAMATSVVWISLSFAGFNAAIYVASESEAAGRIVPRALIIGTGLVTVLYLALNLIFVTSTPGDQLVWQEDVAAIAARSLGGVRLELLVRAAVALGLLSSVSSMIMSGPRVYAKMADDGVFPRRFSAAENGIQKSVFLQTVLAIGLILLQRILVDIGVLSSSLLGLLIYLGTTLSVSSACCVATLFLPGIRTGQAKSSLPVLVASGVYVIATLLAVVLLLFNHEVDGRAQGIWHLTGAALTFGSGVIAWRFIAPRNSPQL